MSKVLKETLNGVVIKKYVPNVYENGQYIDEEKIDIITIEVKCGNNVIRLVKPRDSKYSQLFVNDEVTLNKYLIAGDYDTYVNNIEEYIYNYNSANADKGAIFDKCVITKEEFDKRPVGIIDYEINFEN